MFQSQESSTLNWVLMGLAVGLIAILVAGCASSPADKTAAPDPGDARTAGELAERARLAVDGFDVGPNNESFNDLVKRARGIFIVPQSIRAAFIFGGAGGSGVLLARDEKTGQWNGPAFYTLGRGSFGLQAGAEVSEVVALVMTERGVTRLLSPTVELGGDLTVAAGPVGGGLAGASAGLSADIVSYARSKGLYAGLSLQGAVITTRNDLNHAFYGGPVTPVDVLVRGQARGPQAEPLRAAVTRLAEGRLARR
jgi:lipid-binding SYLF domain-containing protein